jgi:hypothetical protein
MIDYAKLAIIGAVLSIAFGSGWWLGYSRYVEYKKSVEIAAKVQEAKVESITKQQALVTKGIENEYNAKLALLRQYYANGVRQSNTSSLPTNSGITPKPLDVSSAYSILIGQCAETTQQLVSLQEWLNEQMGIK